MCTTEDGRRDGSRGNDRVMVWFMVYLAVQTTLRPCTLRCCMCFTLGRQEVISGCPGPCSRPMSFNILVSICTSTIPLHYTTMAGDFTSFINCRLCKNGDLVSGSLIINNATGQIVDNIGYVSTDAIDLNGAIIAPGFIELQTNGLRGFHFTHFEDALQYANALNTVARYLPSTGVTGFYVTIPTVASEEFKKVRQYLTKHYSSGSW